MKPILPAASGLPIGRAECGCVPHLPAPGEVVVDGRIVTSRRPADLPAFMDAVMRMLGRA